MLVPPPSVTKGRLPPISVPEQCPGILDRGPVRTIESTIEAVVIGLTQHRHCRPSPAAPCPPIPGTGQERDNRLDGLGALAGIVTGVGVGALAGAGRALVLRLGPVLGPVLLGASAMTATDAALTRLGLTGPRKWDATAWASDAAPHLAFGVACYATLRATTRR